MNQRTRDEQFSEFVVARRARLVRLAYLLCGDAHRAEDIVQSALTKLYLAWPRLHRDGNVDAYARRIVVRTHLDVVKQSGSRHERATAEVPDIASPGGIAVEDRAALLVALQDLPPGQRRVVVLRYYWQLDVRETAADIGCSVGTVKSQSAKALAKLADALSSEFGTRKG